MAYELIEAVREIVAEAGFNCSPVVYDPGNSRDHFTINHELVTRCNWRTIIWSEPTGTIGMRLGGADRGGYHWFDLGSPASISHILELLDNCQNGR